MKAIQIAVHFLSISLILGCGKTNSDDHAGADDSGVQEQAEMPPITTVEDAIKVIEGFEGKPEDFRLPLSDELLDPAGLNKALITDKILEKGFEPNGFEQRAGFRVFRYKSLE